MVRKNTKRHALLVALENWQKSKGFETTWTDRKQLMEFIAENTTFNFPQWLSKTTYMVARGKYDLVAVRATMDELVKEENVGESVEAAKDDPQAAV